MEKDSSNNSMDLDFIDELLLDGLEFPHFDSSTYVSSFEQWLDLDIPNADSSTTPSHKIQDENQISSDSQNIENAIDLSSSFDDRLASNETSKKLRIGPRGYTFTPVMDRLIKALGYLRNCSADRDALIQIWVPIDKEGNRVLTTNDQPFSLDLNHPSLAQYREISLSYQFSTDEAFEGFVGLPGRVFRTKVPEWTPDVRFFTWDEYPRIDHAQKYDVRGSLVVPVLEHESQACLGVIEVVLTKQKFQYRLEIQTVCKALEAVNLRTVELSRFQNPMANDLSYQTALPEIREVLRTICTKHKLPLAQTWVSCILQGKEGCRHSDENVANCISPIESACYIFDSQIKGFHEACSEYHMLKGLGVVGKALTTNQPCYSHDVTACTITEYPLSHYTRMFGLKAAVAIRLRSTCTGSVDFVLEFFLPVECKEVEDQKILLSLLSETLQNACRTLRVVTDEEVQQEFANNDDRVVSVGREIGVSSSHTREALRESSSSMSRPREKTRSKAEKMLTLQEIKQHFAETLKDAARNLGVCPTTLKRICRQQGIRRWPSRTIKKVGHSLQKIQCVIDSVNGASSHVKMEPFYSKLASENPNPNTNRDALQEKINDITSCSHSSSSKRSSSMEVHSEKTSSSPVHRKDNQEETPDTNYNQHFASDDGPKVIPSSHHNPKNLLNNDLRMKVSCGEDTIRLRMHKNWKYLDLLHEISKRFKIEDTTSFNLKYLDDDGEWILLTCDADLEECIDLHGLSPRQTIKLMFQSLINGHQSK